MGRRAVSAASVLAGEALPLTVLEDHERLPSVTLDTFRQARPEARTVVTTARNYGPERIAAWLKERLHGPAAAAWTPPDGYAWMGETTLCRLRDVRWLPRSGAVVDRHGVVVRSTVREAELGLGGLAQVPGLAEGPQGPVLPVPPRPPPSLPRATVWMPWGGLSNYGHFLIDGLSSLLAADEAGLLDDYPPAAPRLGRWQRDLLAMAFPGRAVRETGAPLVEVDEAVFCTAMNHFLHAPNELLARLRDRILRAAPPAPPGGRRVYISRRRTSMRVLVNEAELERALQGRGFRILRPETMTAAAQAAAVREAEVVVGATGAGLANALYLPPGGRLIEIQPENFTSFWAPMLTLVCGRDWLGYVTPSPAPSRLASPLARARLGFRFAWTLPLDDFLPFLDARL